MRPTSTQQLLPRDQNKVPLSITGSTRQKCVNQSMIRESFHNGTSENHLENDQSVHGSNYLSDDNSWTSLPQTSNVCHPKKTRRDLPSSEKQSSDSLHHERALQRDLVSSDIPRTKHHKQSKKSNKAAGMTSSIPPSSSTGVYLQIVTGLTRHSLGVSVEHSTWFAR